MVDKERLGELAERCEQLRVWLFGRYWFFGPASLSLALCAAALRSLSTPSMKDEDDD